ncbi:hypothetical protein KMAL_23060 [Novacetimonas maltaceti]|uniref:Uncharacterized protein n=1 Tax=Novacetimonas maltaceti TaxID=1203393 RepID=A0A2S3VZL9_9PROT|nr:hypothetical protein KMAL_23060 [Novacetimonas maltaceti]
MHNRNPWVSSGLCPETRQRALPFGNHDFAQAEYRNNIFLNL